MTKGGTKYVTTPTGDWIMGQLDKAGDRAWAGGGQIEHDANARLRQAQHDANARIKQAEAGVVGALPKPPDPNALGNQAIVIVGIIAGAVLLATRK